MSTPHLQKDIYLAANRLIDSLGEKAAERAAERAIELKKLGDAEGAARFALIVKAITALQAPGPHAGARLH